MPSLSISICLNQTRLRCSRMKNRKRTKRTMRTLQKPHMYFLS